jgi:molybdopterin converting factor subunit 1
MTIDVQLFASYAEAFGTKSLQIKLPEDATVEALMVELSRLPGAEKLPKNPLVAVNLVYAKPNTRLAAGDEVAVIPPVAGG